MNVIVEPLGAAVVVATLEVGAPGTIVVTTLEAGALGTVVVEPVGAIGQYVV